MVYNLTKVDAGNTTYEMVRDLNTSSNPEGLMVTSILYAIGVVIFIFCMKLEIETRVAFVITFLIMFFIGVLFVFAELISFQVIAVPLVGLIASILTLLIPTNS